jgi:hypothetical protein
VEKIEILFLNIEKCIFPLKTFKSFTTMNTNNILNNHPNNMQMTDEEFFALHPQPALTRSTGNNNAYNSLYFADINCCLQEEEEDEDEGEGEGEEEEDLSLYERKRCVINEKDEDIPMDISDSDGEDEVPNIPCLRRMDSYSSDYELAPRKLFPDIEDEEDEEEEDEEPESYVCSHGVTMTSRDTTVCDNCYDDENACYNYPEINLLLIPKKYQRQTTICTLNGETGCSVYNGNPNGDRLLECEDEDLV